MAKGPAKKTAPSGAAEVRAYIARYPLKTRSHLRKLRAAIREAVPMATERMAYGLPTYTLGGNLVHFGAFTRHVGFYPGPSGIAAFRKNLKPFKSAKGSVQFPIDDELPLGLVKRIVKFRVRQNLARKKALGKRPKRAKPKSG